METTNFKGHIVGDAVASATDVMGRNCAANFVRGFVDYYSADDRARRAVIIASDMQAFRAWKAQRS